MPTFLSLRTYSVFRLFTALWVLVGFLDPALAQDNTRNYVLSRTYKVPLKDAAVPVSVGEATLSLGYFDGLGRLQQTVSVQAGKDKKDVVAAVEYDALGRVSKTYLPANTSVQNGTFQPTAAALGVSFYTNATRFAEPTDRVYTESLYEASPLNRPVGQTSAGTTVSTTIAYGINGTDVRKYQAGAGLTDITRNGNYGANQLTITQTIDEERNQSFDFTDKDGRLVLRRAGSTQAPVNTYYVYDDLNQLRAIVQPAYDLLLTPQPADIVNYAFFYLYDSRGRLWQKKVPGAGVTVMEYNKRDLLISSTDAKGQKFYFNYDVLNRQTEMGVCTGACDATNPANTANKNPLSYTYYDDYESSMPDGSRLFDELGFTNSTASDTYTWTTTDDFVPATMRTAPRKGQVTGQCMRLLNADGTLSSFYNCQVNYYDNRYRLIQTVRKLPMGTNGIERISYKRDFAGKVLRQKTAQSWSGQAYTLEKLMSYDHAERLTGTRYITGGTDATLAGKDKYINALTYNEIGQLTDKYLNATDLTGTGAVEHLTYKNNVRGWLREHKGVAMANRPYSMLLSYQNNGNVLSQAWRHPGMAGVKTYQFTYDELNRMKSGIQDAGLGLSEALTYDLNGNIQTLNRTDASGTQIDKLTYSYWPDNRLRAVSDGAANLTVGFIDYPGTDDYSYDQNGNITTDYNKGIFTSITYNYLNLPLKITLNGKTLSYVYDAAGTKHSLSINGTTTSYEGIFEYDGNNLPTRIQTDEGQLVKSGTAWQWQYYLKDHLGNVRVVLDENGTPKQETDYYPFGLAVPKNPAEMTASRAINKYLYLNRELQEQTGWLDLHARFYDPTIGRFLTIDPQTESQEHLSPYHYGYDNPIRFSDPEGRMGDDCCEGVVSFVAGVGSAFRDNFGSPDGRSLYRDQVSHVGEYNSGREWGHKGSLVVSAFLIAKGIVDAGTGGAAIIASDGVLALPGAAAVANGVAQVGIGLNGANNAINNLQKDKGKLNSSSTDKPYAPKESLPRDASGNPVKDPKASGPHTQLGTKQGSKGNYRQAREFDSKGKPVKDIDFTDHGRPQNHTNPHQHQYLPNETGGTPKRGPQEPLN